MSTLSVENLKHPSSSNANITLDSNGNINLGAGSASLPSITAQGDTNTGIYFPAADNIGFATGGTIRGRWTDNGLCFGTDTAAANALDDYEEGTWTPVLSTPYGFTEGASPSYTGKYIKIGKQVTLFFNFDFNASDVPAADDRWRISGLPFLNADIWLGVGTFMQMGSWASDTNMQGICTVETDEIFGHNVKINGTPPTYAATSVTGAVTYQTS